MTQPTPPPIMWAQRSGVVFITVCLEDCKEPIIKIEPETLYFKGSGGTDKKDHEVTISLYKEVNPEESVKATRGRTIEITLKKTESSHGYWPQLTKEKAKYHWLRVDFDRWENESNSDEEENVGGDPNGIDDLSRLFKMTGGPGDAGDNKINFDDLQDQDSDDDLPDLE